MPRTGPLHHDCETLLKATLGELQLAITKDRRYWTVESHLPVVPHVCQLCLFALYLLKGIESKRSDVLPHRDKAEELTQKAYRHSMKIWLAAMEQAKPEARQRRLDDVSVVRAKAQTVVAHADRFFGIFKAGLAVYGVTNVQEALATYAANVSLKVEAGLGIEKSTTASVKIPGAVYASIAVGRLLAETAGQRTLSPVQISKARFAGRLGARKDDQAPPESVLIRKVRGTLKLLASAADLT